MPQMPYLNCEWSSERRAISEELKKVTEEMKRRKKEDLKILRQTTWATQSGADSMEIASSHPPENDGGHSKPRKKASRAPPQPSDPGTESEAGSGTSSDTEGPDETSSNSEGPDERKTSLESIRDMGKHDKLKEKLRRRKREEKRRLQKVGKLRQRLTDDINLISSYLGHSLHVSILSS